MSIYFEKARELGELMLKSEQGLRLADARAVFESDANAVKLFEEFKTYQEDINKSIEAKAFTQQTYQRAIQALTEKTNILKAHPIVGELVKCEDEFLAFANEVLSVVKATVTGDVPEEGCGKSCGGCEGCN